MDQNKQPDQFTHLPQNLKVWALEDNLGEQFVLKEILSEWCELHFFASIELFERELLKSNLPNLVIADLRLEDGNFLNYLVQKNPKLTEKTKIIVVSSVDDLQTLRTSYHAGVLDYLTKPFGKAELVAKVENVMNRQSMLVPSDFSFSLDESNFHFNPVQLQLEICINGQESGGFHQLQLTAKEFQILLHLFEKPNFEISREDLTMVVWGKIAVSAKTLDVHISNLRSKLRPLGFTIVFKSPDRFCFSKEH